MAENELWLWIIPKNIKLIESSGSCNEISDFR